MAGKQSVECRVDAFFRKHGESEADPDVLGYVCGTIRDTDEDTDPQDICDMLAGFLPDFEALTETSQLEQVLELLCDTRAALTQEAAPVHEEGTQLLEALTQLTLRQGPSTESVSTSSSSSSDEHEQSGPTDEQISFLLGLCPEGGVDKRFLCHVLKDVCSEDLQAASQWLLDHDLQKQEEQWRVMEAEDAKKRETEAREMVKQKKQITARFQYQFVPEGSSNHKKGRENKTEPLMWAPPHQQQQQDGGKKRQQVRYNNNQVVSYRGEKYVVENLKEDWDGGSSGKVYTKGKRGKGFV